MLVKEPLIGKTLDELKAISNTLGMASFTAGQVASWLYAKNISEIDEMTNLSLAHRELLKQQYTVGKSPFVKQETSADGTVKYLFPVQGNRPVEAVYIPDKERATLCISTQVGCKMNCRFCMTGKQGFMGQLSAADIINQVLSVPQFNELTNIVVMGMGEPMDNLDNLLKALEIMTSVYGFAWSPKRITVSSVGVIPGLKRFIEQSSCHLAISIHSPYHDERLGLMPIEKAYPIAGVIDLLKQYDFAHQRRLSFEYIMFGGLNDDLGHADGLARLLRGIPCRVNLIKYHRIPGIDLPSTDPGRMASFRDYLTAKGITTTIRASRGEDIQAACGMLSSRNTPL